MDKSRKLNWKERRTASAEALARLNADRVADAQAWKLASDDPRVRHLGEEFLAAYKRRDLNALICNINRHTTKIEYLADETVRVRWLVPVPWLWLLDAVEILGSDDADDNNELLMNADDLCFGFEASRADFEQYACTVRFDTFPEVTEPLTPEAYTKIGRWAEKRIQKRKAVRS